LNTLLAFVVSVIVWQLGFWPAGDSKFFIFLAFLLPLTYYQKSYLEFFPSFVLLCNIFVVFLVTVFLRSFWTILKKIKTIFKSNQEVGYFKKEIFAKMKSSFFQSFSNKKKILKDGLIFILQFCFVTLILYFIVEFIFKKDFKFETAVVFFVIFYILRKMIDFDLHKNSHKKIKSWDLKPGDIMDNVFFSKIKCSQEIMVKVGKICPEGLNLEQALMLKSFLKKNDIREIMIYKTVPFSIWMILGVVATIFLRGIVRMTF
jgi:hypothetical protein